MIFIIKISNVYRTKKEKIHNQKTPIVRTFIRGVNLTFLLRQSESAIQELKKLVNKYRNINDLRGFLTDLRNALGIPDSRGASKYGVITIPKEDGTELVVSLRITNHQANANTYIEHNANYEYNLSIVTRRKARKNTFIPNLPPTDISCSKTAFAVK